MPRTTFGLGSLNAAAPGLSRLAQSLAGGDQSYQQGFDQAAAGQSRIAQALAQIRQANAAAGQHDAAAENERAKTGVLNRRPDLYEEQAALASGSDVPTVRAYRGQVAGGPPVTVPMGPPTEEGAMGATPLPAEGRSKIASALQQFLPLLANSGDLNPEQLAKASETFRGMGLSDHAIADPTQRNAIAGGQAAARGNDLFSTGSDGAVLDKFAGGLATDNPMARSTIELHDAQASHARAQAGLSRAQAAVAEAGGKGVIQQTDEGMVLVDPRNGTARPIVGPDGIQIAGKTAKLKDVPPTANKAIIEGQQSITNIDEAIKSLADNPNAGGWTNSLPGAETVKQMWASPGDVMTRGQVANIGSLVMHDRSGASVTISESPRLKPFIPSVGDSNKVAAMKLMNMKRIAEEELGLYSDTYSPDNGYRASPILQRRASDRQQQPAAPAPAAASAPLAGGFHYLGKEGH